MKHALEWLNALGSIASILALVLTLVLLRRARTTSEDVSTLKREEEAWHHASGKPSQ